MDNPAKSTLERPPDAEDSADQGVTGPVIGDEPLPPAEAAPLAPDRKKQRVIDTAAYLDQERMTTQSRLRKLWLKARRQFQPYYFTTPPRWRVMLRALMNKERMSPGFGVLGAVRSGTSLLSDYVMQHPCVVLPMAKEIGVMGFGTERLIKAQFPTLEQAEQVRQTYGMAITGYCTPQVPNLSLPFFAKAMAPQARIGLILRNPVDRAFAHWRWDTALLSFIRKDPLWRYWPDFEEIIDLEMRYIPQQGYAGKFAISGAGCGYLQSSTYLPFLEQLCRQYGRENIQVINADDFFNDTIHTVQRLYDHLGLPSYQPDRLTVKNAGPKKPLDPGLRQRLAEYFEPVNARLYEFLGRDMGWS